MVEFTLDTSGIVAACRPTADPNILGPCGFHDLDPFTQGYVEAMLNGVTKPFEVARVYQTRAGNSVCIMQVSDRPGYECVKGDDPADDHPEGGWRYNRASDRGRATGSAFDMSDPRNLIPERAGFSDLAPETLAAILKDCREVLSLAAHADLRGSTKAGREFWERRQAGRYDAIIAPPLTVSLGDDGKVYLRVSA